jgi:hypothetical protein
MTPLWIAGARIRPSIFNGPDYRHPIPAPRPACGAYWLIAARDTKAS